MFIFINDNLLKELPRIILDLGIVFIYLNELRRQSQMKK